MDLFQSLKDEPLELNLPDIKSEELNDDEDKNDENSQEENDDNPSTSNNVFDEAFSRKRKLDKQNRKELEEEEREKML